MNLAIETALVLCAVALALARPRAFASVFEDLERRLGALARRPLLSVGLIMLLAALLRLVNLALLGWPEPQITDDFSIMLQADTFLQGRLANPVHPLHEHFETVYVNHVNAYGSIYFPGRSLAVVLGLALFGEAGAGTPIFMVLLAGAIVWALRGWTTPELSLIGGLLGVVKFGVLSWTSMGAEVGALAGMLVLGAYPRLMKHARWRDAALFGLGAFLLALNRPFEGLLFCLPFVLFLAIRFLSLASRRCWAETVRLAALPAIFVFAAGALNLAYNAAGTGDPLKTPYQLHRAEYAVAPTFLTSPYNVPNRLLPAHVSRFYELEAGEDRNRSLARQARRLASKARRTFQFYVGPALLLPFAIGMVLLLLRPAVFAAGVSVATGVVLSYFYWPYYLVPALGLFLLSIVLGFGWLRRAAWRGRPVGLSLSRTLPLVVTFMTLLAFVRLFPVEEKPTRAEIETSLERTPGRDLVIVSPTASDLGLTQWVYNAADIDNSEIVWAYDLGPAANARLIDYFRGRRVWALDRLHPSALREWRGPVLSDARP